MPVAPLLQSRLLNQQIACTAFTKPEEIVQWMGAMQAQDFAMAKWAIGLRLPGITDGIVETAFNDGKILRTHLLRPTWHFVSPQYIRWMLALTAPRVNALNAYYYRKCGLDTKVFNRCNKLIAKALEGGRGLTRNTLADVLKGAKINADGLALTCIMMRAELDGIVCSGPRQGKQFTYALLEERVPPAKAVGKKEALALLTQQYFAGHGPATVQDFANWASLTMAKASEGLNSVKGMLQKELANGQEYWVAKTSPSVGTAATATPSATFLMPDYDEYALGYKDRRALFEEKPAAGNDKLDNPIFNHTIMVNGVAAGNWKRAAKANKVGVEINSTKKWSVAQQKAVDKAVKRYVEFVQG